jgi:SAM-dependent methyltransferase
MAERDYWERHHADKRMIYPTEEVVRFFAYAFPDAAARRGRRALDLGAGSGRHAVLMARLGFDVVAADYSYRAAANVRAFLAAEALPGRVTCAALDRLPFAAAAFDVVVPWECIFYGDHAFVKLAVAEVRRVLKPGGVAFFNLRSPEDSHVGEADLVSPGVYVSRGEWPGVTFAVFTEAEARALVAEGFATVWFDPYLISRRNGESRDAGWMLLVRKS